MKKLLRMTTLVVILAGILLVSPGMVSSQVQIGSLKECAQLAFSTEEDFVSGDIIISDGDLLGLVSDAAGSSCYLCARNADLLQGFDEPYDLGLDAADVINVDSNVVALSTELDSHNGLFTAGDLLVTNGVIILNQALTAKWSVGYDLGLDTVHFVGDPGAILEFLAAAAQEEQPIGADVLARLFEAYGAVDIWFSTEGTWVPASGGPGFLDGDLLSAQNGTIMARNSELLDPNVPADVRDGGVDFGLDAATGARGGTEDLRRLLYSTEILYEGEENAFTDGDVLQYGNGVVATNYELIKCFQAKADFLGLDALSVGVPEGPPACISRITDIAGVDVGDISLVDGMAHPGTVGSINAPVPFGGWLDISGTICDDVDEYRVVYRKSGTADSWKPIPVPSTLNWQVKADAFIPWGPDCLGSMHWYSDPTTGWYGGGDYRHLTESSLGGCNPGLALTVWESAAVPTADGGPEALYDLVLETKTTGGTLISDTVRLVQLDNTAPETHLKKEAGVCNTVTSMPLMIEGRIKDDHFHSYQLRITGDGYGTHSYPVVEYYDLLDPGATNLTATGTLSWPNNVQLHEVDLTDLHDPAIACGYSVLLTAWDRTLACNFKFPTNQAYHCPGCRHTGDAWTFNYEPGSP